MRAGPHFYVISLSRKANALFEAFRDTLIDIQNGGFPVVPVAGTWDPSDSDDPSKRLRETLEAVDEYFGGYYRREPLMLVVVGEREMLSTFSSLTAYREAVIGRVEGDYSATSLRDLGKIVWPIVKDAMSGLQEKAMHDLENAQHERRIAYGIDSVSRWAGAAASTLLVEGDYHLRGSLYDVGSTPAVSREVSVADATDDVVDAIIEKVLAGGGRVVFVPSGSLKKLERIVLLRADGDESTPS